VAVAFFARHRSSSARRSIATVALGGLFLVSLAASVLGTELNHSTAFFVTPTRIWEFAIGGLNEGPENVELFLDGERPEVLHDR
ncbi:hypothetical protein ACC691_40335, partial [Rhizobium johnstonii]|uniref:hypothetical protein n=1 Tax=Rhizobium johnstonii TaxID=3019933 RepID=UPI003F983AF0